MNLNESEGEPPEARGTKTVVPETVGQGWEDTWEEMKVREKSANYLQI